MTLPAVDVVFLLIVTAFAVIGAINGFFNEIFGKAAPVVSAWVSILFYKHLVPSIEEHIKIHLLAVILSFLLIFIAVFIFMKILQNIIKNIFDGDIFKSLDRFLGFVFGIVEGLAIVGIILILIEAQPWFKTETLLKGSFFVRFLNPIIALPLQTITDAVEKTPSVQGIPLSPPSINLGGE